MVIFDHTDSDGDRLFVDVAPEIEGLIVSTAPGGSYLTVDKANKLHAALGKWLIENNITMRAATAPPVAPLTPSDVVRMIRDEVARVVPLQQMAAAVVQASTVTGPRCGVCGKSWNDGHGQPGDPCRTQQAPEQLCVRPRPADAHAAARCTFCGHLWTEHAERTTRTRCGQCDAYNDTPAPHVCEPEPEHHGRLMAELPRRVRKCIGCAHAVIDHIPPARNWGGGCLECPCDWMGPTR